MNPRHLFFETLKGSASEILPFMPITMMFAADRVGKPYREYATDFRVQTAGQLAVAEAFGAAHISAISDPAVEASDMGASVIMPENAPPALNEEEALLKDKAGLRALKPIKAEEGRRMSNRLEALQLMKEKAGDSLVIEGWVEGPCAEAADLRGINSLMMDFFDDPSFVNDLMDLITEQAIDFALKQIEAGADLIGIGDAASSLIGPDFYGRFVLPRMHRYVKAIQDAGGRIRLHICGDATPLLPAIAKLNVDMIDLDSMVSLAEARSKLGPKVILAGNLNPVTQLKDSHPAEIKSLLKTCRKEANGPHIVGAGCEVPRGTPEANLRAMGEFARSSSPIPD